MNQKLVRVTLRDGRKKKKKKEVSEGGLSPEKPGNYSNVIYPELSKLIIMRTGEVVKCHVYGGKS